MPGSIRVFLSAPSPISPRQETAPHLAFLALKRTPKARGTRALPWLSIVDSFFPRPKLSSVAGSVAPDGCHLVRQAAGALPATLRVDGQSDTTLTTSLERRRAVASAEPSPRSGVPVQLYRVGQSDSRARYKRCSTVRRNLNPARHF